MSALRCPLRALVLLFVSAIAYLSAAHPATAAPVSAAPASAALTTMANPIAVITTSMGVIRCELFAAECPETVRNFLGLAEAEKESATAAGVKGKHHFYDGLIFHRVIQGFMIQGGCPHGNGQGGPGYSFADEINAVSLGLDKEKLISQGEPHPYCAHQTPDIGRLYVQPRLAALGMGPQTPRPEVMAVIPKVLADLEASGPSVADFYAALGYAARADLPASHRPVRGSLCMANAGPNTNGSQFFLNLGDTPHLTGKHTVFGQVISGQDVLDAIGAVPVDPQGNRPLKPVTIVSIRREK